MGNDISFHLFIEFQDSQALLPIPRPAYVVVVEIFQIHCITYTGNDDPNASPNFTGHPPDAPLYRRFENVDVEEEGIFPLHNVGAVDYRNDSIYKYTKDVCEYLDMLREYTGEGGGFPIKPPIVADAARGFVKVQPCYRFWCPSPAIIIKHLMNELALFVKKSLKRRMK